MLVAGVLDTVGALGAITAALGVGSLLSAGAGLSVLAGGEVGSTGLVAAVVGSLVVVGVALLSPVNGRSTLGTLSSDSVPLAWSSVVAVPVAAPLLKDTRVTSRLWLNSGVCLSFQSQLKITARCTMTAINKAKAKRFAMGLAGCGRAKGLSAENFIGVLRRSLAAAVELPNRAGWVVSIEPAYRQALHSGLGRLTALSELLGNGLHNLIANFGIKGIINFTDTGWAGDVDFSQVFTNHIQADKE